MIPPHLHLPCALQKGFQGKTSLLILLSCCQVCFIIEYFYFAAQVLQVAGGGAGVEKRFLPLAHIISVLVLPTMGSGMW